MRASRASAGERGGKGWGRVVGVGSGMWGGERREIAADLNAGVLVGDWWNIAVGERGCGVGCGSHVPAPARRCRTRVRSASAARWSWSTVPLGHHALAPAGRTDGLPPAGWTS